MTRLVLAGAGAAQFILLDAMARGRVRADEVVMIGPATQLHGPMIPGWLAGRFTEDEITGDVRQLAQRAGCRFVEGMVRSMDAATRTLVLDDGSRQSYDLLSLTPDEQPAGLDIPGASRTMDACPGRRARQILPSIAEARAAVGTRTVAVAVAGAGLTGFEMAIALSDRVGREASGVTVMLVDPANPLLPEQEPEVRRLAMRILERKRIGVAVGARIVEVTPRGLTLTSGAVVPADVIVWCLGVSPAAMLATSGLALDAQGFVLTDATLRSTSNPEVFLAPAHCFRAGATVVHNLADATGTLPGKSLRQADLRPPRTILIDTGADSALMAFGRVAREGRWARRLKDSLDRRLMTRLRTGPVRAAPSQAVSAS